MALNFGKVNRSASFNPTSAFPLDARYYFETLAAATEAVKGAVEVGSSEGTYFYGENVVVVENGKATLYLIQPDKTLTEVGSVPVGDEKSITVVDGKIKVVGFDDAETGAQPRKKADGTIEWVKPDTTTVEGLQTLVSGLESDVESLQTSKANAADVYTKDEVDGKISGVYHYKGTVATYSALPSDAAVGDVYNIETADAALGVKAGDNAAWNGSAWDILSGTVDLSNYFTKSEVNDALANKVDKNGTDRLITEEEGNALADLINGTYNNVVKSVDTEELSVDENGNLTIVKVDKDKVDGLTALLEEKVDKVAGSRLMTDEEGTKLAGIDAGANVNILEKVMINNEALTISEKGVNIPIGGESLGTIKSATGENKVTISADGEGSVPSVNVNTLVQTTGETLILNGGSSSN